MANCLDYALKYIHRFPKTEKELRIQLYIKGYPTSEVDKVIEEFKRKKYVNDEMFAESYIRSEVVNKGKPAIRIIQKLQQKGITQDILKEAMKKYEGAMNDGIHDKIKREIAAYKKKNVEGFDIIQKLLRKGYRLGDIKHVISSSKT